MYQKLPSEIQANATTYDILVSETYGAWQIQKENEDRGIKPVPKLTQEQMMQMIEDVKKRK